MDFLVTVTVLLKESIWLEDKQSGERKLCRGYARKFGVHALSDSALRTTLEKEASDGRIEWSESNIETVAWHELDDELRARAKEFGKKRIWYAGPYFYYP
jgi:hypothetical protein